MAIAVDNLSDPESADTEAPEVNHAGPKPDFSEADTDVKKAVEEVVTEGDTKVEIYKDEYDEYHADGNYQEDGYIPDEADYYQQQYTYKADRWKRSIDTNKSKPMPKQNSLFVFSYSNR